MKSPQSDIVCKALEAVFDSPIAFLELLQKNDKRQVNQQVSKTVRLAIYNVECAPSQAGSYNASIE
jgi:hypothetical protein